MITLNKSKIGQSIESQDKKHAYYMIPFESASYSDLSAYNAVLSEFIELKQQIIAEAFKTLVSDSKRKLTRFESMKHIEQAQNGFNEARKAAIKNTCAVMIQLLHVSNNKFNIVFIADKKKAKNIDLKEYAIYSNVNINFKQLIA